jgi:hypothetical protein
VFLRTPGGFLARIRVFARTTAQKTNRYGPVHGSGAPPQTRQGQTTMRNTIIALALAAAALTAGTSASQAGYGHGYGYGHRYYQPSYTYYQPTYYCHTVTFRVYDEYACEYVYRTKQVCN